jgi:Legionella pneumophila major outer membrane protein precursor/BON domain
MVSIRKRGPSILFMPAPVRRLGLKKWSARIIATMLLVAGLALPVAHLGAQPESKPDLQDPPPVQAPRFEITVEPPPAHAEDPPTKSNRVVDERRAQIEVAPAVTARDQQLSDAVAARLMSSGMADGAKIRLKTVDGSVELMGTVVSSSQAGLLVQQATTVAGALKVHSSLMVTPLIPGGSEAAVAPIVENIIIVPRTALVSSEEAQPSPKDVPVPVTSVEMATPPSPPAPAALPPCGANPPIKCLPAGPYCPNTIPRSTDGPPKECNELICTLADPHQSNGSGFIAGASVYVLRPFLDNNVAFTTTTGLGTASPSTNSTTFSWNAEPAYAIWAGYDFADGFGIRARWFHLDASSDTMTASNGPGLTTTGIRPSPNLPTLPGTTGNGFGSAGLLLNSGVGQDLLTFTSSLRIDALDAEATYDWQSDKWMFSFSGGGRFLSMKQEYHAALTNNPGDGVTSESQNLDFTHKFTGGGPTIDFQAAMRIGQSNFSVYANGRASLLVGRTTEVTNYSQIVSDPRGLTNGGAFPFSSVVNPTATNSTDTVMPITEIELGLEYGRDWGRSHWFVRAAAVNQTYFGAGSASHTDGDLSLFGGRFTIGLDY